jgi:hypothetical protein
MNDAIKLSLSADELELVCNKDWILAKKIVIDKVYFLMGELSQKMQKHTMHNKNTRKTTSQTEKEGGRIIEGSAYIWQGGNAIFFRSEGCSKQCRQRTKRRCIECAMTYIPCRHYDAPIRGV